MKKNMVFSTYSRMSVVSRATLWFMVSSFVQKGLSFITTPIFTRLMSQEQFGLYSVYTSWLQIMIIISTFRLDYSVFNKGMSKYPEDRDGYTSSMLGLTTVITTILFVLYLIFSRQINSITELSTIIMCAMFVELYANCAVSFWSLREKYDFRYKAVVFYTLATAIFSSVLGIVSVIAFEDKGAARILSGVLVHALGGMAIYYVIFKRSKKFWSLDYSKYAVVFNIPLIPHYFSTYMIEQADRIMIQKLVSFEAAALYSVAYTVGGLVKIFTAALTNTLIPLQYRLLEKKDYHSLNKNIIAVMLSVVCLLLLIALAGPEIILILGGEEYMPALGVIPPVAASVYFSFLYTLIANIEFFFGKNKFAMKISIVGAMVNVLLNLLLIPRFGFVVAAYTTLFSYIIYAVGHMFYVKRILKTEDAESGLNNRLLLGMGIISMVGCILLGFLYGTRILRVILGILILFVVFINRKTLLGILKKKTQD